MVGTIVTCDASADTTCSKNTCAPATGACSMTAVANGTLCDDGNACTTADTCTAGSCGGSSLVCNDGNDCTNDGCDPATGTPIVVTAERAADAN